MDNVLYFAGLDNKPEIFYTLEGEGEFVGRPSIFMRLSHCNLTCKGFASADSPSGCDSFISWSKKNSRTFDETFKILDDEGFTTKLNKGALLKLTGGEPLIWQKTLLQFIEAFVEKYEFCPYIDFETNATIMPDQRWRDEFNATFTTSPKMSNNGDPEEKRYKPEVLRWLVENSACFKFVISKESDLDELYIKYINHPDIKIPTSRIWLMPCCGSRDELIEKSKMVAEMCKEHNFNFSSRLQLLIWNKAITA